MSSAQGTAGLARWRTFTLRDVVVFTLPPLALAAWLVGSAVMDYHRVRQFDDWWSNATSVRKFAWYRARTALRSLETGNVEKHLSAEREDLPLLRLMVDRSEWDRIDEDVGGRWGEWIDVQMLDGGDWFDAELRFRGDGSAHWTSPKKSFTLKTRKSRQFKGFRTLAFSVKDVLPQWLVGTLAADFGLLAPEQQLVPVYLNDRFYGIHRFVETVDEAFLRRNGRLPGNVFRADNAERGDYFKGLPREVFENPHVWERVAANDRPSGHGASLLPRFLADLAGTTAQDRARLTTWLDREELARLFAFLLIAGDPYHMSGVHNQFWYEDPSSGKLHPIPWDVRLLDLGSPPHDARVNAFWRAVLEDPVLWDGVLAEVERRLESDHLWHAAGERVERGWMRFRDAFRFDALREGIIPPVGDPDATLATLRSNLDRLAGWLADARTEVKVADAGDGVQVVDLLARGTAAHLLVGFETGAGEQPEVRADSNRNGVLDAEDAALAGAQESPGGGPRFVLATPVPLLPGIGGERAELSPVPVAYRFFVRGAEAARPLLETRFGREAASALPWSDAQGVPWTRVHPWDGARAEREPLRFSGGVLLAEDLRIPAGGALIVEAGTTLRLAPGVSIVSEGRVELRGTAEAPITVTRADEGRPWGTFALQGASAKGSRIEHVSFRGGSGALAERVEYRGMVSICNARDVALESCELSGDRRCDDALWVAESEVHVRSSRFHDNSGDGIDFDSSEGTIEGNVLEDCGADAIEIAHGSPRIARNRIARPRERGIAIGEDSRALVFANTIEGAPIGIEVRDGAEPVLLNDALVDCARGIRALEGNPVYGQAGWPKLGSCSCRGTALEWEGENGAKRTRIGPSAAGAEQLPVELEREWMLRAAGIRLEGSPLGPVERAALAPPLQPLHSATFAEDLADPSAGWRFDGRAPRVIVRGRDLQLSLDRRSARIARPETWDLSDERLRYVLVAEIGTTDVLEAELSVLSAQGDVRAPIRFREDPDLYEYTVVELPARRYDGVVISATPFTERAQLRLHSVRVFGWPAESRK